MIIDRTKKISEIVNSLQEAAMDEERKRQKIKNIQWLKKIDRNKIICLELKTIGIRKETAEILELSIIDGNGVVLFDEKFIPKENNKHINIYIPILNSILENAELIIGYNIRYRGLKILTNAGVVIPKNLIDYDVAIEFSKIYGERDLFLKDYKWKKLEICVEYYGYAEKWISDESLENAKAILYCFNCMIDKNE